MAKQVASSKKTTKTAAPAASPASSESQPGKLSNEKRKSLDLTLSAIRKSYGEGAIMTLSKDQKFDTPSISTGVAGLDIALGIHGVPRGRVVEIYGPESSGKTTLCLNIIAQAQKKGGIAAFIDAEHAFDPTYARMLGVQLDDLLISQPDTGEQALEISEMLIKSNAVDIIVVDSVAALVPKAEIDGEMGQQHMGLQARLMSHALRKLTGVISKSKTCLIFINQLREKIGVMFGNPETTPGGRALKFYSSVRLDIRKLATLKKGDVPVGNRVRVKVVKNKCAAPFRQAEFDLIFAEGVSSIGSLLEVADQYGITKQSGSWILYGEEKLGQGRENARLFLKENPKVLEEIEEKVQLHATQAAA